MKPFFQSAYQIYRYFVLFPMLLALTIFMAGLCIITGIIFGSESTDWIGKTWARACCMMIPIRVKLYGKTNYSTNQSYVVVANHQSLVDIPVIEGIMGLNIKWVMKKELYSIPIFGPGCKHLGCILIDRSNSKAAIQSINNAARTLSSKASVLFFAEGTRSKAGKILPFKKGAFVFAMETGLPLLPVSIKNSRRILPSGSLYILPGQVEVIVHPPVILTTEDKEYLDIRIESIRQSIAKAVHT